MPPSIRLLRKTPAKIPRQFPPASQSSATWRIGNHLNGISVLRLVHRSILRVSEFLNQPQPGFVQAPAGLSEIIRCKYQVGIGVVIPNISDKNSRLSDLDKRRQESWGAGKGLRRGALAGVECISPLFPWVICISYRSECTSKIAKGGCSLLLSYLRRVFILSNMFSIPAVYRFVLQGLLIYDLRYGV